MSEWGWVEYGVTLKDGSVAPAADAATAAVHPRPAVSRPILCIAIHKSGDAAVDYGPWLPLQGL